jgi:hypothetical protein
MAAAEARARRLAEAGLTAEDLTRHPDTSAWTCWTCLTRCDRRADCPLYRLPSACRPTSEGTSPDAT